MKLREGKKWKPRFACVTRLSPVADSLTLQLWKDRKDWEKHPPTKGSIALEEYIGWEAGFTLDRESNTLAIILKQNIISFAFDNRENLIRWQVRVTSQFEEGQHFNAHLLQLPTKSKLGAGQGPVKVHIQNRRFSLTSGVPPKLLHSWELVDLRRYGPLETGRFCFEGGSRCGKGEGIHLLRLDDPEGLQKAFESASQSKLESRRKSRLSSSNSFSSHLDHVGVSAATSVLSVASTAYAVDQGHQGQRSRRQCHHDSQSSDLSSGAESTAALLNNSRDDLGGFSRHSSTARSLSRCRNPSTNWSSTEGSVETMSVALSDMTDIQPCPVNLSQLESQHQVMHGNGSLPSPDHLVNRKDLLERMGLNPVTSRHSRSQASSKSMGGSDDFAPQWSMEGSTGKSADRMSISSHSSQGSSGGSNSAHPSYDIPKGAGNGQQRRSQSTAATREVPHLTPKTSRKSTVGQTDQLTGNLKRVLAATPCLCTPINSSQLPPQVKAGDSNSYENYDIPRHLSRQEAMQFYDTPRSVKEALLENTHQPPYGNYDIPHQGAAPIPVFRKQCGCIMKLVNPAATAQNGHLRAAATTQKGLAETDAGAGLEKGGKFVWACIGQGVQGVAGSPGCNEAVPKVRLTGTGKMPVMDMSGQRCQSLPPQQLKAQISCNSHLLSSGHPAVAGLPPKSPVYAVVNKANRKKLSSPTDKSVTAGQLIESLTERMGQTTQQQHHHNYCNIAPNLGDVITNFHTVQPEQVYSALNKKQAGQSMMEQLTPQQQHLYENSQAVLARLGNTDNYMPMGGPGSFDLSQEPILPVIPFDPVDYASGQRGQQYDSIDPISQRLRDLHDALEPINVNEASFANLLSYASQPDDHSDFNLSDLGQNLPPPPPEMLLRSENYGARSLSIDNLPAAGPCSNSVEPAADLKLTHGCVTMPRASKSDPGQVTMRRSASVPCKGSGDRGSTSSSDSGFSPGSPSYLTGTAMKKAGNSNCNDTAKSDTG